MHLHFLGAAATVTGSRFYLTTERASILIDCGMFQGSPDESIRNRIPLGFDPKRLDAILITHAHLDHCGLLPLAVKLGFAGPIHLTSATAELAELVLLDSGRLQEEFAKRGARWEARHPDEAIDEDREAARDYVEALDLTRESGGPPAGVTLRFATGSVGTGEHVETTIEPANGATPEGQDAEADLRAGHPELLIDLDAPLYTENDAAAVLPRFRTVAYDDEIEVAPGIHATFLDAGHILGSAIIRLRVQEREGGPEQTLVFSGDLGRPGAPILRNPSVLTRADYVCIESTYGGREHEPQAEHDLQHSQDGPDDARDLEDSHPPLGGHIVQGHVDGKAMAVNIDKEENSFIFKFRVDKSLTSYLVNKGSVCINGISLTVIEAKNDFFSVGIIPYTWNHTMIKNLKVGDKVNIEVDILAKYILSFCHPGEATASIGS